MTQDPFVDFKAKQRESWTKFLPIEVFSGTAAPALVRFAGVKAGQNVLDVGCGTGVVALTARRQGAKVTGSDLTPELLARAKENASIAGLDDVAWKEADVENLPFRDAEFDVVLSQFGHMFAPRPDVAVKEMLRVLKPGGRIAFSTWPPELLIGRMFATVAKHLPPPPGAAPPPQWGVPDIVRERLGSAVKDLTFDRHSLRFPALSPEHWVQLMSSTSGPIIHLSKTLDSSKFATFRRELVDLGAQYFEDNVLRQDYLMTRATKA